MTEAPSYGRVEEVLSGVGAEVGPSQAHGMLCGMMSAPTQAEQAKWIAQVLENTQPRGEAAQACLVELVRVFEATAGEMDDPEFGFEPMLPSEDEPLARRARALGHWCDGFLFGVGLGELKRDVPLPPEVSEALRDLGEIAQVELDAEAGEENEAAYTELVEYVRMAALLVLESLRPTPGEKSDKPPEGSKRTH